MSRQHRAVQKALPDAALNVPAAQASQEIEPSLGCDVPGAQLKQNAWPASGCEVPDAQFKHPICPVVDWNRPAGHCTHEALPDVALKVPAAHASQEIEPSLGCDVPGAQLKQNAWPASGCEVPDAQFKHPICPVVDWNRPAGHCTHEALPDVALNVPAAQFSELVPSGQNVPGAQSTQTEPEKNSPGAHWARAVLGTAPRLAATTKNRTGKSRVRWRRVSTGYSCRIQGNTLPTTWLLNPSSVTTCPPLGSIFTDRPPLSKGLLACVPSRELRIAVAVRGVLRSNSFGGGKQLL